MSQADVGDPDRERELAAVDPPESTLIAPYVWALGVLATVAAVLSRAVVPSLLGVWEGADHIITLMSLAGAGTSQWMAIASCGLVVWLVLETVKSDLPQYVRAFAVGVGMLTLLALSISAVDVVLPTKSRLVVAAAAAFLVGLSALVSARIFTLRAASLSLGAVAVAGLVRIVTVGLATHAIEVSSTSYAVAARALATAAWLLDAAAVGLMVAVVTSHAKRGRRLLRPRWTVLGLVLLLPLLFAAGASVAADPERSGLWVLLANIVHHNRVLPATYVPGALSAYLEVLRWTAAGALLIVAPRSRLMAGALALALFSRSTLEVPLCAAAVVIAALALGLHPGPDVKHDLPRG